MGCFQKASVADVSLACDLLCEQELLRPSWEVAMANRHTETFPVSQAFLWCFMQMLTGGVCLVYHSSVLWFVLYGFCF